MKCRKVRNLLNRYIDKEIINQGLTATIEGHLSICPHCQAELKALVATKDLLLQKEKIVAGEDFLSRLKKKIKPEPQIFRIKWLPEAGELARRLIPVPVVMMVLVLSLIFTRINGFSPADEYILGDLTNQEIGILSGDIDNSDLWELLIDVNIGLN